MALVRISQQLLSDVTVGIETFAQTIKQKTIDPLLGVSANTVVGGELAEYLETYCWREAPQLKDQMPSRWCGKADYINLDLYDQQGRSLVDGYITVYAEGKRNFKLPPGMNSYGSHRMTIKTHEHTACQWVTSYATNRKAYMEALDAHNTKFRALREQVIGFLNGSKSLNDALKKFPDIGLYVPKEYIERVEVKVERAPREVREAQEKQDATATIDTNLLTTMGVLRSLAA
jgi:hypothetical protein